MNIYIASDHNGVDVVDKLVEYYKEKDIVLNTLFLKHSDTDDYPDFAFEVSNLVIKSNGLGILLCGTGIGMSIAANKVDGVRAARCTTVEDAKLSREHNHANVLCLSYKIEFNDLVQIINTFLNTLPSEEERHIRRVDKILGFEGLK